jgi:hypothetical protein
VARNEKHRSRGPGGSHGTLNQLGHCAPEESALTGKLEKVAVNLLFGMVKGGMKFGIAASQMGLEVSPKARINPRRTMSFQP